MDVRELTRIDQLNDYRATWDSLLDRTAGASFFHSLEWLEVYWRHFGAAQRLRVLVVSSGEQTVGIVPLVIRPERTRIGQLRVLTYPLHDWGSFYGPITANVEGTLAAALDCVRSGPHDWDLLELRWIDAGLAGPIENGMRAAGFDVCPSVWNRTAVIDLPGTWDDYLAQQPAKWRSNVRRDQRRLGRQGQVEYVRYRPRGQRLGEADPRWDLYDMCEQVARRSWQGSSKTGTTLSHDAIRPFLRDAHAAAVRRGEADLNLLYLNEQPLAFSYNYCRDGQVYGLRTGYDAGLSRDGAGNVLHLEVLRDSFARGDRLFDLGVEYFECKRQMATRVLPIFRLSYFHPASPRAQLVRVKRWLQTAASLG